ncbi:uncharacterized protein LOC144595797 isoform X2 [Rhinoraja longicauda]
MSSISKHFISGEDNGALGQHEQTEWQILNGLLQHHGFKPIQLMASLKSKNQNNAILLDKESAMEIREVVKSLIKDTERRQALIWDLVQSNKKLKKDVSQQQSRTSVEKFCMSDLKQVHDTVKSESPEVQDDYYVQCCQHQNQLEQLKHDNQDIQVYCDELEQKLYEQEKTIVQLQKKLCMVVTEEEKCIERCKLLEQTTRTHTRPNKQWFEAVDTHKTQTSCLPQELSDHKKIENVPSAQKGESINIRKYLIPREIPEDDKWEMACEEHLLETNFKNHTLQNNQNQKQALKSSSGCCVNKKLNSAKVEDIDCLPEATCKELLKFLGTIISRDLKWGATIDSTVKKFEQRMYFLRQLRKHNLPQAMMAQFYTAIIESILTFSIMVWFGSATKHNIQRLQRIVRSAEKVVGCNLAPIDELYTARARK